MSEIIIVINAGSTSIKFAVYAIREQTTLSLMNQGEINALQTKPLFVAKNAAGEEFDTQSLDQSLRTNHHAALLFIIAWLEKNIKNLNISAVGHRVLLGGTRFDTPVLIDDDVLTYLDSLTIMEPSHQRYNVEGIRLMAKAYPGLPQVACFDTSFHRTMPELAQIYALPKEVLDTGARHWGYHGISYDYISREFPKYSPNTHRVIVAHLGGGASMCAMMDGKSIETTMGFGSLSGLPMATRSGDVPQDLLLYLLRLKVFDDSTLEKMLYDHSGMLGLSGISSDMRELEASDDPHAAFAIAYFVYAMMKYTGAYVSVLGGLDAFVFTAGIGENSAFVRAALCRALAWLGIILDETANESHGPRISSSDSSISVWVIPTNEDLMIAQHTLALIQP
jgi:acetate kinase